MGQPAGMINVILAMSGRTGMCLSRVLFVAQVAAGESQSEPKRARRGCHPILTFSKEDKDGTTQPHDDALVITLRIGDYDVKRVMVDGGSTAEVMYPDLYKGLGLKPKDLSPYSSPLMSFDGKLVIPEGMIRLPIQTGPEVVEVDFIVVNTSSPYTTIVGRPWLHTLGGVASSLHQKVKFPSGGRILEIRGCQSTARQSDTAAEEARLEGLEKVVIDDDQERFFQVGTQLPPREKEELLEFLKSNLDVFAWDPCDAPGIDPSFICHRLNVNPSVTPKKQPPRRPSKEHAEAIKEEVNKLKCAGAIKEEKTAFVMPIRNYHYKVMPFDLKNVGSTYQRMMTRMFKLLFGKNIEIYVDDMVVKSKLVSEHLWDLGCIFDILRKHRLRLNASKCSFGVGSGKFLGYIITHRGIEVDPDQIRAIQNLRPPRNPKEIQRLAGMIAALNRFISKLTDRCRLFYLLINKWKGI
nr:uncharacterized protein LOC112028136 [Quercus suber]